MESQSLWKDRPVVVLAIRRPGCVACRAQAQDLWARRAELEAAGVGLAVVVNQTLPGELEDFADKFWPGDVYLDPSRAFYRALGQGEVRRAGVAGALLSLLNPFSRVSRNMRQAGARVKDWNMKGDGLTLGGVLLVTRGGVPFAFQERAFGDAPGVDEVVAAAARAGTSG